DTTITLGEPDSITASITSDDTTICRGGTAQIHATAGGGNGPPYIYNWTGGLSDTSYHEVSPNTTTSYELTTEDTNGCVSPVKTVTVNVLSPLVVSTLPDDTICPGGTAQLDIASLNGGSAPYSFVWTNSSGDTLDTGQSTSVQPSSTTDYIVHVDDACETTPTSDTMTISLFQGYGGPDVDMAVSDTAGCYPFTVDFTCLVPSNSVQSTFWSFGDGTTSNDSGTTQHTYMEPGCYDVTLEVTSVNGCVEDSTFEDAVCARPYPTADFVFDPPQGNVLDPQVSMLDRSSGAVGYEWSFEHVDSTSSLSSLEMKFPNDEPGSYDVEQWVVNQYGCPDSITKTLIIEGVHQLYVPNAFTPDGDGINDVFRPKGEGIAEEKYRFQIYDRWGKLIFQTKDPREGWDGTINGEEAKNDVYVWKLSLRDAYSGRTYEESGHVTLIR
ncbi:MAG: T9SS type B sorting domain-containing protein, partial [Flavobacteriales bacterium]